MRAGLTRCARRPQEGGLLSTFAPVGTLMETLLAVAGRHRAIEENLEAAKGEVGLDHYEVRHYHGWYRHITLSMLALAYLAVVRSQLAGNALKGGFGGAVGRPQRLDPAHHPRGTSAGLPAGCARPGPARHGAALVALASPPPSPRHVQPLPTASMRETCAAFDVVCRLYRTYRGCISGYRRTCRNEVASICTLVIHIRAGETIY